MTTTLKCAPVRRSGQIPIRKNLPSFQISFFHHALNIVPQKIEHSRPFLPDYCPTSRAL